MRRLYFEEIDRSLKVSGSPSSPDAALLFHRGAWADARGVPRGTPTWASLVEVERALLAGAAPTLGFTLEELDAAAARRRDQAEILERGREVLNEIRSRKAQPPQV